MFKSYLKVIQRNILRQPLYFVLNLACLTIGIAGSIMILLYVHFELTYDTHHRNSQHIYRISTNSIKTHERTIDVAWSSSPAPLAAIAKTEYPGIVSFTRLYQFWASENVKLEFDNKTIPVEEIFSADSTVFDVFSFDFIEGDASKALVGPDKIVLSESVALKIFGEESSVGKILKTTLIHNIPGVEPGYSLLVTGVYRDFPNNVHLYPAALVSSQTDRALDDYYFNQFNVYSYLLLDPKTNPTNLAARLSDIYTKFLDSVREPVLVSAGHELTPIPEIHTEETGGLTYVYIFCVVGVLLLFISGASYINLTTAQANRRAREIGIRKVMGSQKTQLTLQFFGESFYFILLATALAVVLLMFAIDPINQQLNINIELSRLWNAEILGGILIIIVGLTFIAGCYPALLLSSFKPVDVLKGTVIKSSTLQKTLVSIQLSIVLFVLVSTSMIYKQLEYLRFKDLGFDKDQIVSLSLPDGEVNLNKGIILKQALLQNPTIVSVAAADFIPGNGAMVRRPIAIDGSKDQEQKFVYSGRIDQNFIPTMGMEMLFGRNFSHDHPADTASIIVNETLVRVFQLEKPLGDKVRFGGKGNPKFYTIVGVANDFHQSSLYSPIEPQVYTLRESNRILIKVTDDIHNAINYLTQNWKKIFPDTPFAYSFIKDDLQSSYTGDLIRGRVFLVMATLTISIAFLGLFGLASLTATQKIKEIGVRKILGASLKDIVLLITSKFLVLAFVASIPAFVFSWFIINQWLENFAFRTQFNYLVFAFSLFITVGLVVITTGLHAWKAASVNPLKNLRTE